MYWVADSSTNADEREEKWRSLLNHVVNIHKHDGHKVFVECLHSTVEREWLKQGMLIFINSHFHSHFHAPIYATYIINFYHLKHVIGSAAHKKLTEMPTRPRLITAIRKLSQYHQTSTLEAKHAIDNLLASKNTYHSYHSLSARLVVNVF